MRKPSTASLKRQRTALVRQLPSVQAILRGSLLERYKRCGKPGCCCARGLGHGPKYYLSVSRSGENPQVEYVPQGYHEQVETYLGNYRVIKEILKEISRINSELLRRRELG